MVPHGSSHGSTGIILMWLPLSHGDGSGSCSAVTPFLKAQADIRDAPQAAHRAWKKGERFALIFLHPGAKRDELGLKQPFQKMTFFS